VPPIYTEWRLIDLCDLRPYVRKFLTRWIVITSRLTTKAQTTIPQPVRTALGLEPGDEIAYEIADGTVILRKAARDRTDDPFRTFSEWDSKADRKAYGKLQAR
jgi:antitoxin PrlF